MKIVEMKGTSHVYTLNDGTTFRIYARKTVTLADELISDEMRRAEKLRILRFIRTANSQPTPTLFEDNSVTAPSENPVVEEAPVIGETLTTNTENGELAVQTSAESTATTTTTKKKKLSTKTTAADEGSEK